MIIIISNFTSNKFYPSQNPINITVSSDNTGNCNFRYICDLYVNGVKVFTDKLFPDPNTSYGFFQLSRVIQDYIKTFITNSPQSAYFAVGGSTTSPASAIQIYCQFGEEYDDSANCDGTVLQYTNLTLSNTAYAYQSAFAYEDFPTYTDSTYKGVWASASNLAKFLTNSPREVEVTYNDSYYLDFISLTAPTAYVNPSTGHVALEIKEYKKDNTTTTTSIPASSLAATRRWRLAVGPWDINKISGTTTISQFTNYYTIRLVWRAGSSTLHSLSETFTFNVKAPKPFQTRIGFVGLLGSIENFTFYHRRTDAYDIQKRTYEKTLQSNSSGVWGYSVGDRGTTTWQVSANEKGQVSTFCSEDMSRWLSEMWLSPDAWIYKRESIYGFRNFKETGSDRILFWFEPGHGYVAGDQIYLLPSDENSNWSIYNGLFTIVSVNGDLVDFGITESGYTYFDVCGYGYKKKDWQRLPVTISDQSVELKQRTSRPIQYSLNWQMAYSKTTLR